MTKPKFIAKAETPYAHRVRRALEHAEMDATEAAAALEAILPLTAKGSKWRVKPQNIQYMAQKAHSSRLTPYLARACKVDANWLTDDSGPPPDSAAAEPPVPHLGTGLLNERKREQIGARLFSEIKRCKETPAAVAARLRMSVSDFVERANHGDLTLEDLAEIVLFLEQGASIDFIVLGRFPKGSSLDEILDEARERAAPSRKKHRSSQ